jgi:hypothetical protein
LKDSRRLLPARKTTPKKRTATNTNSDSKEKEKKGVGSMQFQFRPIVTWPGARTTRPARSRFAAPWSSTLDLLDRELRQLQAKNIVLQADVAESQIRLDGMLYASARPRTPGVILSFESKHGPLSYPCDRFDNWQDNVRAIALSLEALRSVDRYGVTRRAEQYRGWQQLPAPGGNGAMTPESAAGFIVKLFEMLNRPCCSQQEMLVSGTSAGQHLRVAEALTHPDRGGDSAQFKQVQQAREVLEEYFGRRI